jgi:type IVB pilus formation R64 PilN family outer membrane protein
MAIRYSLTRNLNPLSLCASLISAALLLSACHTEDYRNTIAEKTSVAEQRVEEARVPAPVHRYNPLTVTDSIWNGGKAVRMRHGQPLPSRVEGQKAVAMISSTPMTLRAIANAIAAQTGVQVRLDKDAEDVGGTDEEMGGASAPTPAAAPTGTAAAAKVNVKTAATSSGNAMRVAYEGPLSGLLDRASSHFGLSWRYDGAAVLLSKYETRVFVMNALPGTQKVSDGLKDDSSSNQASSSGSAQVTTVSQSAATQSSSMDIDFKFWDEIGKTMEVILNGTGSYSLAPSSGTVTVMTTPEVMRQVSDYLNQENNRLGKQVAINVEVYTIDLNEGEDFNVKFDTALRRLTNLGLNFASAGAPARATGGAALGSLSVAVLNPETIGQVTDLFSLLSTVGKTSRVAQFPMTTLNNRPVSRRVGQDRTYLASVQTNTSQTFQNTTLTPGIIRDGFSIQVTPRILQDGNIILQYSLSLVDLLEITKFTSVPTDANGVPLADSSQGASQIQLPRTATRVFVQQSMLRSGSTLVLAGYDQDQITQNSSGLGNPDNYLLGGGVGNSRVRQVLFLAMTPQEISLPRTENE